MTPPAYTPPDRVLDIPLSDLLAGTGRLPLDHRAGQAALFGAPSDTSVTVHVAGDVGLARLPSVAVVGTRAISDAGRFRARRLAREMAEAGIVVVSGLAKGVDAEAHAAAIGAGGKTIGVLGTPLDQATPKENAALQEQIWREHLLVSEFAPGDRVFRSNFPRRNKTMAMMTDGTVVIEASDRSGTLHQAVECTRLGRWLFLLRSLVENDAVEWPGRFLHYEKTVVVESTRDVIERVLMRGT